VASTLQLKPLLGLILDQLKLVIDYTGSSILTVEGDALVFLDHRGPVPQEQLVRLRFPLEYLGPIWEIIASGESILIEDVHDEIPPAQALRRTMGDLLTTTFAYVCSWMAVPLMLREQVSGMLVLASSQERAFTERQATLALAIANQAAIAIENARLYEQAQELAAVEERQKLARELHDSVSQALYGIALGLHTARIQLDRDPERLPESIDDLLSLAQAALAEMRALIFELRPESLEREGLVAALSRQGAALQARHDMIVQMDLCEEPALSLTVKQELYRIAQEALHNTVKHAHARKVNLVLRRTASLVILEVGDDGVGFDPLGSFPGHLGLRSMRERVSHLGGKFQIESAPGEGIHLLAQVPLGNPDVG
jgi:signal transduction histidine kinase